MCMHSMLIACACIHEVCVCIQLGCVHRPYVCAHVLKARNPNSSFLLLFLCFSYIICLYFVLFFYVLDSLFLCLITCLPLTCQIRVSFYFLL